MPSSGNHVGEARKGFIQLAYTPYNRGTSVYVNPVVEGALVIKPELSPDFCTLAVVSATPIPSKYKPGKGGKLTLFDLGVVDDIQSAHFVNRLNSNIFPWKIDDKWITLPTSTKINDVANAVETNAF